MSRRCAVAIDHLAEQDRAPVAELRNKAAELMSRIGHGNRLGAGRRDIAGKDRREIVGPEAAVSKSELLGKRLIELDQPRRRDRRRADAGEEAPGQAGKTVVENGDPAILVLRNGVTCALVDTQHRADILWRRGRLPE